MYINTSGGHLRVVRLGTIITFFSVSFKFFYNKCVSNWSAIALSCCDSFCCRTKWSSRMYTCISPLSALLPPAPHPAPPGARRAACWTPCAVLQAPFCFIPQGMKVNALGVTRTFVKHSCPLIFMHRWSRIMSQCCNESLDATFMSVSMMLQLSVTQSVHSKGNSVLKVFL